MSTVVLAELAGRPCPIAAALELVGERWALLVVREIALGATHFSDIVAGTGAPRDRIAARLKALESAGIVDRSPSPSSATAAPKRRFPCSFDSSFATCTQRPC